MKWLLGLVIVLLCYNIWISIGISLQLSELPKVLEVRIKLDDLNIAPK